MTGTSPTTFAPNATLTRAQLATILWRMENEPVVTFRPVFVDVPAGQWFSSAIIWAYDNQIVMGNEGVFAPHANITREAFATMMHRYAVFAGEDVSVPAGFSLNNFADHASISGWATAEMRWAVYSGLITGSDNRLSPQGNATRAQAATILMRFLGGAPPAQQGLDIRNLIGLSLREVLAQYGDLVGEFYTLGGSSSIYWSHPSLPDVGLSFSTIGDMLDGLDRVIFGVISGSAADEFEFQSDLIHLGGIGHWSTRNDVIAAFGQPTSVDGLDWANMDMYNYRNNPDSDYDFDGISFLIRRDTGRVVQISLRDWASTGLDWD